MFPSFQILGRTIYTYAVMGVTGLLIAGWFACWQARRQHINSTDMIVFLLYVCVGLYLGSHILYALTNLDQVRYIRSAQNFTDLLVALYTVFGGAVFYGGLIGGFLAGYLYLRIKKFRVPPYADIAAVSVPLFHGFARIGCFLGGCCYGIESKFGFVFTRSLAEGANGVRRFPVQLLESSCSFLLFLALLQLSKRKKLTGKLFPVYVMSYAILRFGDEFLRGDAIRGSLFGLSTSQFLSIWLFAAALAYLIWQFRRKKSAAPAAASDACG